MSFIWTGYCSCRPRIPRTRRRRRRPMATGMRWWRWPARPIRDLWHRGWRKARIRAFPSTPFRKVRATLGADDRLYFLIGADAFAEIETWYRAEDVMELVDFVVVTRPGHEYETPPRARVHRLETLALPVSSSRSGRNWQPASRPGSCRRRCSNTSNRNGSTVKIVT